MSLNAKEHLKAIASTAAQAALDHAQTESVSDLASAKAAAKSAGEAALTAGKEHLMRLINEHFGGALNPHDVKTCMYSVKELKKAVSKYRAILNKFPLDKYLSLHAEARVKLLNYSPKGVDGTETAKMKAYIDGIPTESLARKRREKAYIKKELHEPLSRMKRAGLITYIYGTTLTIHNAELDFVEILKEGTRKSKITKRCKTLKGADGETPAKVDEQGNPNRKKKRAPSAYNLYVQERMAKGMSLADASKGWAQHQQDQADSLFNYDAYDASQNAAPKPTKAAPKPAKTPAKKTAPRPQYRNPRYMSAEEKERFGKESDKDLFAAAPAPRPKKPAAAAPKRSTQKGPRERKLTKEQERQLAQYKPIGRRAKLLKTRVRRFMEMGIPYKQAVQQAQSMPDSYTGASYDGKFADREAGV